MLASIFTRMHNTNKPTNVTRMRNTYLPIKHFIIHLMHNIQYVDTIKIIKY